MVLPLSLLKTAENHPMLLELKNGDTYNGRLVSVNMFMNICLKDVICTSRDGDRFWKLPEVYIRGNSIKYLRIPDEVIEMVSEEESKRKSMNAGGRNMGRGGRLGSYGRGRGDGEGRGGRDGGRGEGRGGRDGGRGRGDGRGGRGEFRGRGDRGRGRDGGGRGRGGDGGDHKP